VLGFPFLFHFHQQEKNVTQTELNEAVAKITGESLAVINRRGFGIADPLDVHYDPERRRPLVFDWDTMSPVEWPSF
jgi:hypothetical protein